MKEKIKENIPFTKIETSKSDAIAYFKNKKREDKVRTLFYIKTNFVTLYKLGDTYNYIIGDLPYTTGSLKYFDLSLIKDHGVVVRFPSIYDNNKKKEYVKGIKLKEIIEQEKDKLTNTVVGALYNNNMIDYEETLTKNGKLYIYMI